MNIISYRLEEKFTDLSLIGVDIRNHVSDDEAGFNGALEAFRGLVLYHGGWNAALDFLNAWESKLRDRHFIVLFFSTEAYVATTEECRKIKNPYARDDCEAVTSRTDLLPYFHLLTYSVESPSADWAVKEKFKSLIEGFRKLRSLDNRHQIIRLWNIVDPVAEQVAEKQLLTKMKDLECVIAAGSLGPDSPPQHVMIVNAYYGGILPPYAKVREDYLNLCRTFRLKKKLSRWQTQRESLNHKDFQHYFYDLIARPSVVNALDDFSAGRCETLPSGIVSVLNKWATLRAEFSALFLRANPEAIASCELSLALLAPDQPHSADVISRYKDSFGTEIDKEIKVAQSLLNNIDSIVRRIQGEDGGERGTRQGGLPQTLGTALSARCKEFSTHVSSLRRLADIAE